MNVDDYKLLSCPFCGGVAVIEKNVDQFGDNEYYIECSKCGLVFNNMWGTYYVAECELEAEAERWNRRVCLIKY